MPLYITSLNSGSNGNCYYIGNDTEAVLIDAGISCRETIRRMARLGLPMERVKAIFVSHEHTDHIRGIPQLAKQHNLPVYMTQRTWQHARLPHPRYPVYPLEAYVPVCVGELCVTAFPKFHDAADPHSFIVTQAGVQVGIFTDIGTPCEHVVQHFSQCHAAFLEANYDEDMLALGRYPWPLKRRIMSNTGHLSNAQALGLFQQHKPAHMTHLLLAHLSKDNNSPQIVSDLFKAHAEGVHVVVASRMAETPVFAIGG
jgi:phosphoribosyl 1,2-cyclic phosphodiesterase